MIKRSSRRPTDRAPARARRIAVALPLVALLGYVIYWFAVAGTVENQIDAWIKAQRNAGVEVSHGGIRTGGFPLNVEVRIQSPSISRLAVDGHIWEGPEIVLWAAPWSLDRLHWRAPGRHRSQDLERAQPIIMEAMGLEGWVEIEAGKVARWEAWLANAEISKKAGRTVTVRGLLTQYLPTPEDLAHDPLRLPLTIDAKGLDLSAQDAPEGPFGGEIDRLTLDLALLIPPVPPSKSGVWPDAVHAWREAGGVLEVKSLGLTYGPLNLNGEGTMSVDRDGQPIGAFSARITGHGETVEALRRAGAMTPGAATAAQIALGLMAKGPPGGPKRLDLPLTLQDRWVTLGAVRLFRLKPVDWFRRDASGG